MTYVSVWAVARLFASFVLVLAPFDGPLLNAFAAFRLGVFQDMPDQGSHDENQEDPRSDNDEPPRGGNICVRSGTAAGKNEHKFLLSLHASAGTRERLVGSLIHMRCRSR